MLNVKQIMPVKCDERLADEEPECFADGSNFYEQECFPKGEQGPMTERY